MSQFPSVIFLMAKLYGCHAQHSIQDASEKMGTWANCHIPSDVHVLPGVGVKWDDDLDWERFVTQQPGGVI